MSNKQKLLDNLKNITKKEPEQTRFAQIYSNMGADRIYGIWGGIELINRDMSRYTGKINKRSITCVDLQKNNFRSYVYETADGRWFDRAGLPINKPDNLVGKNDESEEGSTEETA
jgi:hypothetical protein